MSWMLSRRATPDDSSSRVVLMEDKRARRVHGRFADRDDGKDGSPDGSDGMDDASLEGFGASLDGFEEPRIKPTRISTTPVARRGGEHSSSLCGHQSNANSQ